jgi:YesN/AraC family two-component response regulator
VTSVVLADDEVLVRDGLATLLAMRGVDVLAVAENGRQAIEATREHGP